MRAGAHDYLHKDNLSRLLPAIERELHATEIRRFAVMKRHQMEKEKNKTGRTIDAIPKNGGNRQAGGWNRP